MGNGNDQAASLRNMQSDENKKFDMQSKKAISCISVASGKGGVGKTFISVNLAIAFGLMNRRVLLVDADLGLANADIILGVHPEYSMQDAIFKGKSLTEITVRTEYGIDLISASSGSREMVSMGAARMGIFIKDLISFASEYDVLIFDCAAGIDSNVTSFIAAAPQCAIIANPQPTSIMDVYALSKLIHQDNLTENTGLIVNMVSDDNEGMKVARTLNFVSERYLSKSMELLGVIPYSPNVERAMHSRKPMIIKYEDDIVSDRIKKTAKGILQRQTALTSIGNINTDKLVNGFLNI
ncbi:MAG: hypothetical protein A2017_07390 [Lentisphaerae bacterium GWF2_44_16]|nr:MAG: hypothetical protein A2017_07390 [Lentisphaerae bacterium GWF2_44_16]